MAKPARLSHYLKEQKHRLFKINNLFIFAILIKLKLHKMKKIILTVVFLIGVNFAFSQNTEQENLKKNEESIKRSLIC